MSKPSPIKEAAVKRGNKVWTGKRHGPIIQQMVKEGEQRILANEQGFVTHNGEYLDRKQAFKRAVECGQIKDDGIPDQALVSEDLY